MVTVRKQGACPVFRGIFCTPPRELSTPPVEISAKQPQSTLRVDDWMARWVASCR